MRTNILIVDDDREVILFFKKILNDKEYDVDFAISYEDAYRKYYQKLHEIVFLDVALPDGNGIELLNEIKEINLQTYVIMICGVSTIKDSVKAIKWGAYDFITKPFNSKEIIKVLNKFNSFKFIPEQHSCPHYSDLVGKSKPMRNLFEKIMCASNSDIPVLITGESGTGKEVVANAIHKLSNRKDNPLVPINCAAIPENLLESELFGHEKGAFSGALTLKNGLFEIAQNGTIYLDEIAELSNVLQAKLLRTIETKKIRRTGGTHEIALDFRVISSTNRNISEEIKQGRFREDLYFRLSTFKINISPLRERKEDIPLLVDHFLTKKGILNCIITDEVIECFFNYSWPGNVRELKHVIEYMLTVSKGDILHIHHLPLELKNIKKIYNQDNQFINNLSIMPLKVIQKKYIKDVYEKCNCNKPKAAKLLCIDLKTLYSWLRKFD